MWSSEKEGNSYTQRAKSAEKFCHRRPHVSTPGYYVGVSYGSALLNNGGVKPLSAVTHLKLQVIMIGEIFVTR